MARRPGWLEGPILLAWTALGLALGLALVAATQGVGEEGVRAAIRATARSSLVLFAAAFAASSLRRLVRVPASAWLLRNRRWVGLSMALSHGVHAVAIATLAVRWPQAGAAIDSGTRVGGSLGYAVLLGLVVTSNDRAVAWLGPARWRALHRAGCWVLWGIFLLSFGPGAADSALHAAGSGLLLATAGVRVAARRQAGRPAAPAAAAPAAAKAPDRRPS